MSIPSTQLDTERSPHTRCANCHTVFEVPPEVLTSSDTRVRCGECMSIFDARDHLRNHGELMEGDSGLDAVATSSPSGMPGVAAVAEATVADEGDHAAGDGLASGGYESDTDDLDVTYTDFDLYSEDADLPEVVYLDQTRDTPEFDLDVVEFEEDETFSDTLFAHDVTVDADKIGDETISAINSTGATSGTSSVDVDFIADAAPQEPLVFNYRDAESQPSIGVNADSHPGGVDLSDGAEGPFGPIASSPAPVQVTTDVKHRWLFHSVLVLTLCAVFGGLYLYRERNRLHNNTFVRPVMLAACSVFDCVVPSRVALNELKLLQRNVTSHPTVEKALVITAAFRNEAAFDQRYPVLEIRLSDLNGRLVARRKFQPEDYLDNWHTQATIVAGDRVDIKLEVSDPGDNAHSFELNFRES